MKYTVLTYIFQNGDILREVPYDENVEYICVTDNPDLKQDNWKIVVDEDLKGLNPVMASFYVRLHPFKYCSGDYCITLDGSVKVNESLLPIFEQFEESGKDICVMTNSRARNILFELWAWISKDIINQKEFYKNLGINVFKDGCLITPFMIVKNNEICKEVDSLCWDLITKINKQYNTYRPSQVAMTAALALTEGVDIMFVDESLIQSNYLQWYDHNDASHKRKTKIMVKHKKFFNIPIELTTFNNVHSQSNLV